MDFRLSLRCDYFATIVKRCLGEFFRTEGFGDASDDDLGQVTFWQPDRYVTIGYDVESAPRYILKSIVGIVRSTDEGHQSLSLPLWFVVQQDDPETNRLWTFSSPEELDDHLLHLRRDVLEPFGRPLWSDPPLLEKWRDRFVIYSEERQSAHRESLLIQRKRECLDMCWRAKDYSRFVEVFEAEREVSVRLPESMRLKYEIAKARTKE